MEDDHRKEGTVNLLEDCWFFGNLLNNRKASILRCNSDPASSSNQEQDQEQEEQEMFVIKKRASKANNLLRTPSLPPNFGGEEEDWDDEEDGARMGDLIRQAMPCMIKKEVSKGPRMSKLTRGSSMDPSFLLPPKHNSKGMKQSSSVPNTSKNLQQRRSGMMSNGNMRPRNLERSMSLKNLSDVEVQGFQDLGFKFDKDDLSPSVVSKLAKLQIKEEMDGEGLEEKEERGVKGKKLNPTLSEAWDATQWSHSPPIPKWIGTKRSSEDMKAQIKFWARSVASNVHQEC